MPASNPGSTTPIPSLQVTAPADPDDVAEDVRGPVAGEPQHRVREVPGLAETAERAFLAADLEYLRTDRTRER